MIDLTLIFCGNSHKKSTHKTAMKMPLLSSGISATFVEHTGCLYLDTPIFLGLDLATFSDLTSGWFQQVCRAKML